MQNTTKNGIKIKLALFLLVAVTGFFPSTTFAELTAVCFSSPLSVHTGERVVFSVSVTGAQGPFTYSWSGSEDLAGASQSISKIYGTPGRKTATVTVSSGGRTVNPTCTVDVTPSFNPLSATCFSQKSVLDQHETVNWTAQASGGTGEYQFSWSGSENLSGGGSGISKNYQTPGIKTATVTVTSGNRSTVRTCQVMVEESPQLEGRCFPDFSVVEAGNSLIWTAEAQGGNGQYGYTWRGSENLSGNGQAISKVYNELGPKTAVVTINSGNQTIQRACTTQVGLFTEHFEEGPFRDEPLPPGTLPLPDEEKKNGEDGSGTLLGNIFSITIKVIATIILLVGAAIVSAFIIVMRKKAKKSRKELSFAYKDDHDEKSQEEKSLANIIQSEARKRQVLISADALKELIDKSNRDISDALNYMDDMIEELKKLPQPPITGEERWLVIGKDKVTKYFTIRDPKNGADDDDDD